jgi:glutamate mutase epsilon subunit
MRASRGMGDISPSKMPKGKVKPRRDNTDFTQYAEGGKVGLYENIHKKQARIAAGSSEKMRKPGSKGAPTKADFIKSAKTARKK